MLAEKIPFLLVSLGVGAVGLLGQASDASLKGLDAAGPGLRLALALRGLSFYVEKALWPVGLSPFYGVPPGFGLGSPAVLASAAAFLASLALAWTLRRRVPALGAALAHHAISLAPVLGLVRFGEHLAADRYSYLPALGGTALAAAALLRLPPALPALALAVLGALSWRQSRIWRSDLELWTAARAAAPASRHAFVNLAGALRDAGRPDEAAALDREAVAAFPDLDEPRVNLAAWLAARGRHAEVLETLRGASALGPHAAKARYNRALALDGLGRRREAAAELRAALVLEPGYAEARNNLGLLLLKDGRPAEAERELAAAALLREDWALPRHNRGNALSALGRHAEAAASYAEAVRLDPSLRPAWVNRGNTLTRLGRLKEALACFERALALSPGDEAAAANAAAVRRALND